MESGRWYLSSGLNYRSSYSLNVHLTPKVVSQFLQKYNIKSESELIGKNIRVKGTAIAKAYCVRFGCPVRINPNTPEMYLQYSTIDHKFKQYFITITDIITAYQGYAMAHKNS